jgi:hypothetical protein
MSQLATDAGFFTRSVAQPREREERLKFTETPARAGWSAENFAREQLQRLIQQLFLSDSDRRVRQVLFSAVDRETDVEGISRLVGEGLALEKVGSVGVMGSLPWNSQEICTPPQITRGNQKPETSPLRETGLRLKENLWLVSRAGGSGITPNLHARICGLRSAFDYSIIAAPISDSHEAIAIGQIVDGIVLVLSARHTRRAIARSAMGSLKNGRILGTVLTDRVFPIPEKIYRRL